MTTQSSSIQQLTIRNSRFGALGGTGRHTLIEDTSFSAYLRIGCGGYGFSETVELNNVFTPLFEAKNDQQMPRVDFSLVGTTLTYNGSDFEAIIRWAIPGANYYFKSGGGGEYANFGAPFEITDVYVVDNKVTMATTLTAMPPDDVDHNTIVKGPCGSITVTNSSGCSDIVDASLAPPGSRMFTYGFRSGDLAGQNIIHVAGKLVSITVNVIRAYTGGQADSFLCIGNIWNSIHVLNADTWLDTTFGGLLNLKIAGKRVYTPTTTTGLQTGDTLLRDGLPASILGKVWFRNVIIPYNGTDMSGDTDGQKPIIEYEIVTDQIPA